MWKWLRWVLLGIVVLGAGFGVYYFKYMNVSLKKVDPNNLPQFIQADFIDLDKIFSISKFRSGSGHDYSSGSGEKCRSLKHYFAPQQNAASEAARQANNGLPPEPDGKTDISIFSPVDGKIIRTQKEQTPIGVQVFIQPTSNPEFTVRIFHVYLDAGFGKDSVVKAGQKIGVIGQYSTTDISIETQSATSRGYYSYFSVMPDSVFAKYIARGVKDRNELIITKEYRDANPLQCNGENFAKNYDSDASFGNYVYLSGSTAQNYNSGSNQTPTSPSATTPSATPPSQTPGGPGGGSGSGGSGGGAGTGGGSGGGQGRN